MRLFLLAILIIVTSQMFHNYQMRDCGNFDHEQMSVIAQQLNENNKLNSYER